MVLIPSGQLRVMESQTIPSFDGYDKKLREVIAQAQENQPVPGVSQQAIGVDQNSPQAAQAPAPEAQPPAATAPQISPEQQAPEAGDPMANADGMGTTTDDQAKEDDGSGAEPGTLEDAVYKALTSIGVQHREWQSKKESIFTEEVDLNNGTRSGFYLIPAFTSKAKITALKAQQIANQIKQQFGLDSKVKTLGNWYKVEYHTVQQKQDGMHGSAFDEIPAKSRGKAASTLEGMLKARREELFQTMNKIANRTETK